MAELSGRDPLVVAGIDPGTACMGFGVVARSKDTLTLIDHGVFEPPRKAGLTERLHFLFSCVKQLLEHHKPDVVSLEQAFHHKNIQSALRLGEVRGVVHVAAAGMDIPVMEYASSVAKKSVAGHGGASKEAVAAMVAEQLSLSAPPESHDAADALALALCLLHDPQLDPRFKEALEAGS